ncbi:MAG: type I glyceraldehyde-3-phosphate dehydrogenase [Firmicutes bacterium]|nr:type I glyceraldehyde-3-phosphate dehydrogenase [Bacillota bacterium]
MAVKIGINGFGRIGRQILRIAVARGDIEVVGINNRSGADVMAHLLKYDSSYNKFEGEVEAGENCLIVNGKEIPVTNGASPADIPWEKLGADIVMECTGKFRDAESVRGHLQRGAKKAIIAAPGKDDDLTVVMGVNHHLYDPAKHHIISNASCTTNCLAPVAKVLHENFGIVAGMMTTIHAYTNDQRILDGSHKDLRRARAAAISMIPTTTGAAKAVGLVLPELAGKLNGFAVRVPTPTVSMVDLVAEFEQPVSVEKINNVLREAAAGSMRGILDVCDEPLVSIDYVQNPHSAIVDAPLTMVMGDRLAKVVAWYDNEWGYSERIVDLAKYVADAGF